MVIPFKKLHWTDHSLIKMRQYGLSKTKLLNILRKPERMEVGIVPGTTAVMQTNKKYNKIRQLSLSNKKWSSQKKSPGEVWLMYKDVKDLRRVISAWRYPGVSKPGEEIPIPRDIRREILKYGIE